MRIEYLHDISVCAVQIGCALSTLQP